MHAVIGRVRIKPDRADEALSMIRERGVEMLQGMAGSVQAHYEGIKAFSETDFTADLKKMDVPTLFLHGDDDQVVPIAIASLKAVKLVPGAQIKVYKGYPHGMLTTHADVLNPDLLAFIRS